MYLWGKWGSNCVSKCDSSDMGRALIDFEGVLELVETVSSLRYHVETFKWESRQIAISFVSNSRLHSPSNHPASFNDTLWHGFKIIRFNKDSRDLKIWWPWQEWEREKSIRFYNQNNNSTHASRFLVISFL